MVKSGVAKNIIISHIQNSRTNFGFSTEDLIDLAKQGVPSEIVEVMRNPRAAAPVVTGGVNGVVTGVENGVAPTPVSPPQALHSTLNAGHEVRLLTASDIPFSAAGDGSRIDFVVAEDVKAGDRVVIAKGAPGFGSLIDAEKRKLFGRGGKVTVRLESVKAVDGQNIKLRPLPMSIAASKVKDVAVTKNSPFTAVVEQDTAVSAGLSQK